MSKLVQRLRLFLRPLTRRVKLDWLPALRRSRASNYLKVVRIRVRIALGGESADAQFRLGKALLGIRREEDGYRHWRRAIELEPDRLDILWWLATAHYNRGDYAGAMREAQHAIETQWELARDRGLDRLDVRFLGLSWTGMIGHLALLDTYAKHALLENIALPSTVLLADRGRVSNPAYFGYWRSIFPTVIDDPKGVQAASGLTRYLEEHLTMFRMPDGRLRTLHQAASEIEGRWHAERRRPLLALNEEDDERGWATLERLGVPRGSWFVGLHVREGGPPWRDIHNGDITAYSEAIAAIAERGGYVIRMGNPSMRPLPPLANAVDYAHSSERSDWMDVFLWAASRFFIGTASGPIGVPPTFGVPCVQTNWSPIAFRHWFHGDLVVPKLYERGGRLLTFRELLSGPIGYATYTSLLRSEQGVSVVDNTPAEIAEIVVEMLERTEGTARYDHEDEELQRRFEELHPDGEFAYRPASRVGREWLRRHQDLLA